MNKLFLTLFLIVIIFSSCEKKIIKNNINEKNIEKKVLKNESLKPKIQNNLSTKDTIIDDEFIFRLIENDFNLNKIKSIYENGIINEEITKNKYDNNKIDTLINVIWERDVITFHKAYGISLLQKANIVSENILLDSNIKIGVNKSIFNQKFKKNILTDSLFVSDIEKGNVFLFYFVNNKLNKISYQSGYID